MFRALARRLRETRARTAYVPRHGYPFTIEPPERDWQQWLREMYPHTYERQTPSWVDELFTRHLFDDDSMRSTPSDQDIIDSIIGGKPNADVDALVRRVAGL